MSNWMDSIGSGDRKLGVHDEGQLIQRTGASDPYGLRNVSRHSAENEKTEFPLEQQWHAGADLVQQEYWPRNENPFTGAVSVIGGAINDAGHSRWDLHVGMGPGVMQPDGPGPAVRAVASKRGQE